MKSLFLLILIITTSFLSSCNAQKNRTKQPAPSEHSARALYNLERGNFEIALKEIDLAAVDKKTTNLAELLYYKGLIQHSRGEVINAIDTYSTIIKLPTAIDNRKTKAKQLLHVIELQKAYKIRRDSILKTSNGVEKDSLNNENKEALKVIDIRPRHTDCAALDEAAAAICTQQKINAHISKNYDVRIGNMFEYSDITRTSVYFNVGKTGLIEEINYDGSNKILAIEAMRVIVSLPQFTSGMLDDKPVKVLYAIPVTY